MGPDRGEGWGGQSISHAVSRSVRDSAALLDATTGPETGNPYEPPHYGGSFLEQVGRDPGKLRIALSRQKWGVGEFQPEVVAALDDVAKLLTDLGHDVEEAEPEYDREAAARAGLVIIVANTVLAVKMREEQLGRKAAAEDIEPGTRAFMPMGDQLKADDYARAILANHQAGRAFGRFHEKHDVIVTATLSREPVRIGFMAQNQGSGRNPVGEFMGDTAIFNQTGAPSVSLPLAWSPNNLPIGIMFSAAFGNDALLFRLAGQLEQARPWWDRRPPVHASK